MKKCSFICFILVMIHLFCGCNSTVDKHSQTTACSETITVINSTFSVEEINNGIRNTFNTVLYYHTNGLLHHFLNKPIEYELYFSSNKETSFSKVFIIITNEEHPLSSKDNPRLYKFGIRLTEHGLQSHFCEQGYVGSQEDWDTSLPKGTTYLGHYSMNVSQITPPTHEKMPNRWNQSAQASICLYMDKNNFYSEDSKNLQAGKYHVYIQGFSVSDVDSTIIFEHENGQVYLGKYYFVHDIPEGTPADLNHVELMKNIDMDDMDYLGKLKQNAALHIEHTVRDKGM